MMLPDAAQMKVIGSPPDTATATKALLLLSPSCAGKHSVIDRIHELGLGRIELCMRDTTRPTQVWDDDNSHQHLSRDAFCAMRRDRAYLANMVDGAGNVYGIRRTYVEEILARNAVPVLRGLPGHAAELKNLFAARTPAVTLVTVFMTTDPADAWEFVVGIRGYDVEGRISAAQKILKDVNAHETDSEAFMRKRFGIDHHVVNRWGHLDETARTIAHLLR